MEYKLSILIPTLSSRTEQCLTLVDSLLDQIEKSNYPVEVVTLYDEGQKSIGTKRNELIQMSKGEYICFVDDDDRIASNYIELIMDGIAHDVDCCSLRGVITWNGMDAAIFEHSIKYKAYIETENSIKYERFPNHLNCIRKSIANQFHFPDISFSEDTDWATQIFKSGLIKTEHYIDAVIYHYDFIPTK